ncbi:lipocalin-like domain-containing protein [Costertonia aggregata]|uniref:Lipocalin family protein n=1 Tax=Costertonia aggregata TaxID=343403 RepID=A0A7H9AMB0_9FLAO|nr:lipocalin family protein [Costertonia aggregata]QLG44596.1 lipocalin family protein [Costertonia aggregata]
MKHTTLVVFFTAVLSFSCSSDNDNDMEMAENSIVGTWSFSELDLNGIDASGEIKLANDVIKVLVAQDCEILTFSFKDDDTVTATSKDFTETGRDVKPDGSGLLIECPANSVTESSVWNLEGDQLTFINEDQTQETVTIELDGNTLTIPAEVVNDDNLQGAKAIFKRN